MLFFSILLRFTSFPVSTDLLSKNHCLSANKWPFFNLGKEYFSSSISNMVFTHLVHSPALKISPVVSCCPALTPPVLRAENTQLPLTGFCCSRRQFLIPAASSSDAGFCSHSVPIPTSTLGFPELYARDTLPTPFARPTFLIFHLQNQGKDSSLYVHP